MEPVVLAEDTEAFLETTWAGFSKRRYISGLLRLCCAGLPGNPRPIRRSL